MSTNKTQQYQLNQWEAEDKVLRAEFNQDNAKLDSAKASGAKVFAMDIDAAGLPFLKGLTPPAGSKTVQELREIIEYVKLPFLIKTLLTPV